MADFAVFAVDVPDQLLDVLAKRLVAFDSFAAGRGQLHEDGVVTLGATLGQQF